LRPAGRDGAQQGQCIRLKRTANLHHSAPI
jgi:hypothetical protein